MVKGNQCADNLCRVSLLRSCFSLVFHFLLKTFFSSLQAYRLMIDDIEVALLLTQSFLSLAFQ